MIAKVCLIHKQSYLPTKRHRRPRKRYVSFNFNISIREVCDADFPLAFVVRDYASVYQGDYEPGKGEYKVFDDEIRTYNGKLYSPYRDSYGAAVRNELTEATDEKIRDAFRLSLLRSSLHYHSAIYNSLNSEDFYEQEKSIVLTDDQAEVIETAKEIASEFVVYKGHIWAKTTEPMYEIRTFGLGHNHGGTGFFVTNEYNTNIPNKNYFTALEREKALEYFNRVALGRGDTDSVNGFKPEIEVYLPEMVLRNPMNDHGSGDPFLNTLSDITDNAPDAFTAGLLVIGKTLKDINKA